MPLGIYSGFMLISCFRLGLMGMMPISMDVLQHDSDVKGTRWVKRYTCSCTQLST